MVYNMTIIFDYVYGTYYFRLLVISFGLFNYIRSYYIRLLFQMLQDCVLICTQQKLIFLMRKYFLKVSQTTAYFKKKLLKTEERSSKQEIVS